MKYKIELWLTLKDKNEADDLFSLFKISQNIKLENRNGKNLFNTFVSVVAQQNLSFKSSAGLYNLRVVYDNDKIIRVIYIADEYSHEAFLSAIHKNYDVKYERTYTHHEIECVS